jgi:hypothetical protein
MKELNETLSGWKENKVCHNCDHLGCTRHDEDAKDAEFWCTLTKSDRDKKYLKILGCDDWVIEDPNN